MSVSTKRMLLILKIYVLTTFLILACFFIKGFYDIKHPPSSSFTKEEFALEKNPFNKPVHSPYEEALLKKYEKSFEVLQNKYETLLVQLLENAKADYEARSKDTSIFALANTYLPLVHGLEQQADEEVKTLLDQLSTELIASQGDPSIVEEIEVYYQLYKRQQRAKLLRHPGTK